jgi:hypothetical protein
MINKDLILFAEEIINDFNQSNFNLVIDKTDLLISNDIFEPTIFELYSYSLFYNRLYDKCINAISLLSNAKDLSFELKYLHFNCLFNKSDYAECTNYYDLHLSYHPISEELKQKLIFSYIRSSQADKAFALHNQSDIHTNNFYSKISIVIPVLDLSPATPDHNILNLLDDLLDIEVEVIVIFNNTELGIELRGHPRIDHFAIISENIGVSRAWNIGIDISRSEYTIVVNADMRLKDSVIYDLVGALENDSCLAMVGPQGCLSDVNLNGLESRQLLKGEFDNIQYVDLIMGFLFAVRTDLFHLKVLKFDNNLTPAFSEEIDISRQIKQAGLKMAVIPTHEFSHGGSGSHLFTNKIDYYDQSEIKMNIMNRNDCYLYKKWFSSSGNTLFSVEDN